MLYENIKKIAFVSFLVFLFFVPFNWTWTNIFLFVSVVGVLVNKDLYNKIVLTKLCSEEKYFIFFSFCYVVWCFITLLWSDNLSRGVQLSGRYITIVLFPIFISLARIGGVIKRGEPLVCAFFAGVLVSSFICLYISYQNSWHEIDGGKVFNTDIWNRNITVYETFITEHSFFSYTFLSHFTHPAYYSVFFIFVLAFLIHMLWKSNKLCINVVLIICILYCSIFIFLLQCRAELIAFAVCIIVSIIFYCLVKKNYKLLVLGLLITIVGGIIIIPHTRLAGLITGVKRSLNHIENQDVEIPVFVENENIRVFLWKNAYEVIKRNPILGVGIGDVDSEMENENIKNKFPNTSLGSHNQYLYSWLAMGVLGFLLLLAMFATAFYYGIKNRYFPLLSFTITIMICIMFENMLTRVYGIMFIPWAMQVLLIMSREKMLKDIK